MNHHFHPNNMSQQQQARWWSQNLQSQEGMETEEREHMFEKSLTPSDVGKLNRLVIPKQHAEKYFPLAGGAGSNSGVDSGVQLSFEDESTKIWKFRYSYWQSSQSYVLTKGWSRYVKDKGLEPADVVMFGRLRSDNDQMFITCRRRFVAGLNNANNCVGSLNQASVVYYPMHASYPLAATHQYQPDCSLPAGSTGGGAASQTTPGNGKPKILRLFGVNVECQTNTSDDDASISMFYGVAPMQSKSQHSYQQYYANGQPAYPGNYMDYNWSGDANQMRYHQG